MSYDLLFLADPEQSLPDRDLFREQFAGRAFYTVANDQAVYENPDTGVYFIFDLVTEPLEDEPRSWMNFTLNFYRPHYFALEALPELQAIVSRTSGVVLDPQDPDPTPRAFVAERFLKNWNHGNEQAYRIMREEERKQGIRTDHLTYPTRLLEAIWRWNLNRQRHQAEAGDNVFVPRISFINVRGRAQSTTVWTDAIPAHLPKVDAVLIYRDQLKMKKWFGGGDPTLALASLASLFVCRSNSLRPWALRPQLKRDPLGRRNMEHYTRTHVSGLLVLALAGVARLNGQGKPEIVLDKICFDSLAPGTSRPCLALVKEPSGHSIGLVLASVLRRLAADSLTVAVRDSSEHSITLEAGPQPIGLICRSQLPLRASPQIAFRISVKGDEQASQLDGHVTGRASGTDGDKSPHLLLTLCYVGLLIAAADSVR